MEEYLTTDELCARIKYHKQTVYNLIHRKVFIQGKHFFKPTPKKILFKWSAIQAWIGEAPGANQEDFKKRSPAAIQDPIANDGPTPSRRKEVSSLRI